MACVPVVGCDPLSRLAGDSAKAVATSAARATFDAFTSWVADGASAVVTRVGRLITATTDLKLVGNDAFGKQFVMMQKIGIWIVIPMLLVAVISAVIHRDPSRLFRAVGLHLPLAILGGFAAIQLTDLGLHVTDELCRIVSGTASTDTKVIFQKIAEAVGVLAAPRPDLGGFLALLAVLVVSAGALLVWVELLLRASAIYVAVLFLPIGLAGLVWPATAHWCKRLVQLLAALVLSKFVIVAVLSLAVALMNARDGINVALSGGVLLLLAGFAPFVVLRMVPVVEAAVIGHLEGLDRRPVAAATSVGAQVGSFVVGQVQSTAATEAATSVAPTPTIGGELDLLPSAASSNGHAAPARPTGARDDD